MMVSTHHQTQSGGCGGMVSGSEKWITQTRRSKLKPAARTGSTLEQVINSIYVSILGEMIGLAMG